MVGRTDIKWTPAKVDVFLKELTLDIYFKFVFHAREQSRWDAGMKTMNQIGREPK